MAVWFEPLSDEEVAELMSWDGPLLPLESVDLAEKIDHGTDRGYQQHRRFGVAMCDDCRRAHRDSRRKDRAA